MNKYNKKLRADNIIIEFKHRADQLEKLKESAVEASEVFDLNEVITAMLSR
jgi:hypothetical protein